MGTPTRPVGEATEAFLRNRKRAGRQDFALLTCSGVHPMIDHWRILAENRGLCISTRV